MIEVNKIYQGHVLEVLKTFPDESLDCCITSPPYYSLRSYSTEPQIWGGKEDCQHIWVDEIVRGCKSGKPGPNATVGARFAQDGVRRILPTNTCILCNAWRGELGLEPSFELYLEHLWMIFDEIYRVLKKTGSCWVNMGDSYWGAKGSCYNPGGNSNSIEANKKEKSVYPLNRGNKSDNPGILPKSLLQIPSRFAIGMTARKWILRNVINWVKPSCMPSSAKDRFTVDFEYVYFFVKSQKYFFEQQLEKATGYDGRKDIQYKGGAKDVSIGKHKRWPRKKDNTEFGGNGTGLQNHKGYDQIENPYLRNKRTTWHISPKPFSEAHFAVYPEALVEPMILSGCPEFICDCCGKAREKVYESNLKFESGSGKAGNKPEGKNKDNPQSSSGDYDIRMGPVKQNNFIGYTDCGCNADYHPGAVLDPFGGSGTTGIVAKKLNRNFVLIELQPKYIEIMQRRFSKEFGMFNPLNKAI